VDIRTEYVDDKSNHQRVVYKFRPYVFEGIDSIEIKGTSLMPQRVVDKIVQECLPKHPYRVDIGLMDLVREKIEKWCVSQGSREAWEDVTLGVENTRSGCRALHFSMIAQPQS
jgi:hypothetical protein